jgi:hypothetical protein
MPFVGQTTEYGRALGIALLLIVLQFSVVHNAKHRNAFLQPRFSRQEEE